MTKACIIGAGKRGKRLEKRLPAYGTKKIDLINSFEKIIDVSIYDKVIICVPTYCLLEVLKRVQRGNKKKIVISCIKWLMKNGETVCTYLDKHLKKQIKWKSFFLGGANIDDEKEIIEIKRDKKLELACVLKNTYAIGFGIALQQGENYAAHELTKYLNEYKKLWIKENYRADLLVCCFSDKSRNKIFWQNFTKGKKSTSLIKEKTIEWLYTAQVIEKQNLFKGCKELRKITKTITK